MPNSEHLGHTITMLNIPCLSVCDILSTQSATYFPLFDFREVDTSRFSDILATSSVQYALPDRPLCPVFFRTKRSLSDKLCRMEF